MGWRPRLQPRAAPRTRAWPPPRQRAVSPFLLPPPLLPSRAAKEVYVRERECVCVCQRERVFFGERVRVIVRVSVCVKESVCVPPPSTRRLRLCPRDLKRRERKREKVCV